MTWLELLPIDISISCLLPYIPPEDFDTFCLVCSHFETWRHGVNPTLHYVWAIPSAQFLNLENVHTYLTFRKFIAHSE